MSSQTVVDLVIGLVILGLLVYRQLHARPVRGNQRLLLILLIVGLIEAATYPQQKGHGGSVAVLAVAGSLVLAALFSALRAFTVRIWTQDGQPWAQGSLLTAALWVAALAAHLGYDYLIGQHKHIGNIGNATIVLYLVASLGVQRMVVWYRAQRPGSPGLSAPLARTRRPRPSRGTATAVHPVPLWVCTDPVTSYRLAVPHGDPCGTGAEPHRRGAEARMRAQATGLGVIALRGDDGEPK